MAIRKAHITMTGTTALLCHNGQTADPRNHYAKAMKQISGKRKKTDADLDQLAKIEWFAGLYIGRVEMGDSKLPTTVLPSHVLESAFIAGAKKSKRGTQAKSGLFVTKPALLDFKGKPEGALTEEQLQEALDALYESGEHHLTVGVKVGQAKVMRTRPMLSDWKATCEVEFDDEVMTFADLREVVEDAGRLVGCGDWRPKYGRFEAVVETA